MTIVKLFVVAANGRGSAAIHCGDRLTIRPDGKLDKRRKGQRYVGTAIEPLAAGSEQTIAVRLKDAMVKL